MFDTGRSERRALAALRAALADWKPDATAADRIDRIRLLEEMRSVVAAAQACETMAFVASQRAAQAARSRAGDSSDRVGRGIAAQVALARRISPFEATRYISQVEVLTEDLPSTMNRLRAGAVPESRTMLVARQAAWLSGEHRRALDAQIAPQLETLGTTRTADAAKAIAYRLDPRGFVDRLARAESERHVSLRPAPEMMTRLTALLPMKQGVAAYAALRSRAGGIVGVGEESRSRSQVMADLLVESVTGQSAAGDVPVAVNVIMTDQALLGFGPGAEEPAHVIDGGTVPAELARRMIADLSDEAGVFLRRVYTHPRTGRLAAMDSTARLFTSNQRRFLLLRDRVCRTPWCGAPIRHADHVTQVRHGGRTAIADGQGLCEACNYAKEAEGWTQQTDRGGGVITTTPTGHRYRSPEPAPPGWRPRESVIDVQLRELVLTGRLHRAA